MNGDSALRLFFEEAADLLRDFEEGLLRLERTPADQEVLNRVFRSALTLNVGNTVYQKVPGPADAAAREETTHA